LVEAAPLLLFAVSFNNGLKSVVKRLAMATPLFTEYFNCVKRYKIEFKDLIFLKNTGFFIRKSIAITAKKIGRDISL